MAVINTNINAIYSQMALTTNSSNQTKAMQELSTGKRINSARDDAAGMAISNRMTSQIRGLNQAVRNANDAVNLIQTTDGATTQITNMLQRMRELAVQASNDTNMDSQKSFLDIEFQQLKQQIVQISNDTTWNGFPILNGSAGERVGIKPVYKTVSSINLQTDPPFTNGTFGKGLSTSNANVLNMNTTGVFALAGGLQVKMSADGTVASSTFTMLDGTQVDLTAATTVANNTITINPANLSAGVKQLGGANVFYNNNSIVINQTGLNNAAVAVAANDTINVNSGFQTINPMQANDVLVNGVTVGASYATSDNVSIPANAAASSIAKAAAINLVSAQTGVNATVNPNLMSGAAMTPSNSSISGTITINGYTSPTISSVANNTRASRAQTVAAINFISQYTGVKAVDTGSDAQGVTLIADDGRNIQVSFNTLASSTDFSAANGVKQGIQSGSFSLESAVTSPVSITTSSTGNIGNSGLQVANYTSQLNSSLASNPRMLVAAPVTIGNATSAVAVPGGTSSINLLGASYGTNPSVTGFTSALFTVGGKSLTVPNLSGAYAPATADMAGLATSLQNALQQADGSTALTVANNAGTLTISDSLGRSLTNFSLVPNQNTLPKLMGSNDLVINGFSIPGTTSVTDTVSNTQTGSSLTQCSGIAIAAAINSVTNQTGVTATATPITINGAKLDSTSTYGSTTPLYINGKAILIDMSSTDQNTRLNSEVSAINAQIGITGVGASIDANGGVSLNAADGRNVSVWFDNTITPVTGTSNLNASSFGLGKINSIDTTVPADGITAAAGAGASFTGANTTYGGVTLASPKSITVTPGTNGYGPNSNFTALGFQQGTFGGLVNAADAKMNPPRVGRLSFQVGADANQTVSIDLPDFGSQGPVTSLITWDYDKPALPPGTQLNLPTGPQVLNGVSMGNSLPKTNPFGSFSVSIGGVQRTITTTPTDTNLVSLATDIQNQINSTSGNTDLSVTVQGSNLRFASASGATIVNPVLLPIQNAPDGVYAGQLGQQDPNGNPIINGQPMTRSFIGSKQGANDVLAKLDNVMAAVDATRATMGAVMNRLDYVVNNLTNVSMNLSASNSAISDADYAAASTELSKTSIMQQAATAVLAQANTSQQSVLKLLQG